MDCARFEELLFRRLEGALDAADEAALSRHARTCVSCRGLEAVLREQEAAADEIPQVPDDLLANVVARTSGAACDRVVMMLAESVDTPLDARGALLSAHLDVCADCAAFARALMRLAAELTQLAALDPGASFTDRVLAATTGAPARRGAVRRPDTDTAVPSTLAERWESAWARLVQRPRFALEGAYAAALLVFLVVGLPSTSLVELPVRAVEELRRETARVEQEVSSRVGAALGRGREALHDSAERAARYLDPDPQAGAGTAVASRVEAWSEGAREFARSIWNNLLGPFGDNVRALWGGASAEITTPTNTNR